MLSFCRSALHYDVPSAAGRTVNVFLKASRNLLLKAICNIVITLATVDHYSPLLFS